MIEELAVGAGCGPASGTAHHDGVRPSRVDDAGLAVVVRQGRGTERAGTVRSRSTAVVGDSRRAGVAPGRTAAPAPADRLPAWPPLGRTWAAVACGMSRVRKLRGPVLGCCRRSATD